MERQALSVTELNSYIKSRMDEDPRLLDVCVRGEISNYKVYPSGHHYFTLKDAESSLKCVMFKYSAVKLRFRPDNGMCVTAFGRVGVYLRDGVYQLTCSALMPEGAGDLQVAFEQLKAKLSQEGLFGKNPQVPNTARQVASLPGDTSRGKRSSMPQPKTRPDSPVPSLQGPCDRSLKSEEP